ncbi:hypothetical protein [Aneurinibacillus danicus]|uniref:hypothetical protein n=1 Tax=Aneurinibacillus danicus TaxID=267746 RepID=UPI0011BF3954|nr:hypothetical protein [Aneurinibacillus danicus]
MKIVKKEGEGRGKKIQRRKRRSPFSTLKSSSPSFLFFFTPQKSAAPLMIFMSGLRLKSHGGFL